jgi:hypothetical protein
MSELKTGKAYKLMVLMTTSYNIFLTLAIYCSIIKKLEYFIAIISFEKKV